LNYHYNGKKSDADNDDDDYDNDKSNVDSHYYYQGDELGCSPVLFCGVILKILSTELYTCNQTLKVVLPVHLNDLGPFSL
jgi:hypothetical protein